MCLTTLFSIWIFNMILKKYQIDHSTTLWNLHYNQLGLEEKYTLGAIWLVHRSQGCSKRMWKFCDLFFQSTCLRERSKLDEIPNLSYLKAGLRKTVKFWNDWEPGERGVGFFSFQEKLDNSVMNRWNFVISKFLKRLKETIWRSSRTQTVSQVFQFWNVI